MERIPYFLPKNLVISVSKTVNTIDNKIEVDRGKIQVKPFPWI